jgi:uncharacterized repeat protein (TIGR01451 family)
MVHSAVLKGLLILAVCTTFFLPAAPGVFAQANLLDNQAVSGWEVVPIGDTASLYALDMLSDSDGWAGGTGGLALHYDGTNWIPVPGSFSDVIFAIDMVDSNLGFGTTYQGNIVRYSGGQWQKDVHLSNGLLTGISMLDANNGWAVGYLGDIYRYQNGTWQAHTTLPYLFQAIDMVAPNDGWILGRTGVMLHWNGSFWQVMSTPQNVWFLDVDMISGSDGWAVSNEGLIFHYDGTSWSSATTPVPGIALWSVSMNSSTDGWAVGEGGTIIHYDGTSWKQVASPVTEELHAVDALSERDVWAVGKSGTVLHYTGGCDLSSSTLTVSTKQCSEGDPVAYTIRVRNTGTIPASEVVVTDPLPANAAYLGSPTTTQGVIQGTDPLVVAVGDVPPAGEVTISFQVTAGSPGQVCWFLSNQASISAAGEDTIARQVVTSVGDCLRLHLPLIIR